MWKRCLLPLSLLILAGCATVPITGRSQLLIVPESEEIAMGEEAYRHILRESALSRHPEALRIVRKVGRKIARVADKPRYNWEFSVIDDPERVNAFAVPGGKVAVYTGMFPVVQDEAGLAVVLGHEVAHALARHPGERMSQDMFFQLGGLGLSAALGSNPGLANQVLQVYGLGTQVGVVLPFGRGQESEADRIGLILMAKAGYDPRVALKVWERMEKQDRAKGEGFPPEFLSTHPGYETRTRQLRSWIPEAMKHYRPSRERVDSLPTLSSLDSPVTRAEREMLKRVQAVNRQARGARGERAVVQALGLLLRMDPAILFRERQQLRLGYGQYAALRGVAWLGNRSLRSVQMAYERGSSWSELSRDHGTKLTELLSFMRRLLQRSVQILGRRQYRSPRIFHR